MPFKKVPGGGYESPSGRKFTEKQVKLYYATDGFTAPHPKVKRRKPSVKKQA